MKSFSYCALDAGAKRRRGTVVARDARHARQLLRVQGLQVLAMRPALASSLLARLRGSPLTQAERVLITRQMATLLQAQMPLTEALQAVASQNEKRRVRQLVLDIAGRVTEGNPLATALSAHPQAFPAVYCATVAAAERSGYLEQAFDHLAEHTEAQQLARQRIRLAMVYPLVLMVVSLVIVAFLLGYVVPDVVQVFVHNHQQLPGVTVALMAISDAVRQYGIWIAMVVACAILAAGQLLHEPRRRRYWHAMLLRLPLLGPLLRGSEAARAVRTLAILTRSGVPLVEALEISAAVVGNLLVRQRLQEAAKSLGEGVSLARSLEQSASLPPLMVQMIASAERAGELDHMLERAANLQDKLLAGRIALALSLFEPLMLVVMGGMVLFIVLAILMPILNLNQLVS
ncbi:Type II secretion system protein F [compost metagenome]